MKKNTNPDSRKTQREALLARALYSHPGKPVWYDKYKESIEDFLDFIIDNNLRDPDIGTAQDFNNKSPYEYIKDDEFNFSWDFYVEELDGLVTVDLGIFDTGEWAYYASVYDPKTDSKKEFTGDNSNTLPPEVLKYLRQ